MGDGASKPLDDGVSRRGAHDTYSYWDNIGGGRPLQSSSFSAGSSDPYLGGISPYVGANDLGLVHDSRYRYRMWDSPSPDPWYTSSTGPLRTEVPGVDPYWADQVLRPPVTSSALASSTDWQGLGLGTSGNYAGLPDQRDPARLDALSRSQPAYSISGSPWNQRLPGSISGVGPQPQDTVIIWDWDDTLMCSTAVNSGQCSQHQASQLDMLLEQVLSTSLGLGETIIVTNADELWVSTSARQWAPHAAPLLHLMRVVSARRRFEYMFPGDPFAWKREAFGEVLSTRRNGRVALNLVVLGDSPAEMEAAQTSTMGMSNALVKTVKFKDLPTADDVVDQLRIVAQELQQICSDDRSFSRNLGQYMRYGGGVRPGVLQSPLTSAMSASFIPEASLPGLGYPTSPYGLAARSVLTPTAAHA